MSNPAAHHQSDIRLWKIALVVTFGPLLANLDATIVNLSLPTLSRDLSAPLITIQWAVSGYLLALALALPLTGWLVDRFGARRIYVGCFVFFLLASAACGFARSATELIAFRVLQGIAGGLLAPMGQMMLARFAGPHMARVMGWSGIPVALGPICGPVLAGFILQHASWRWLFFVNVPVSLVALVIALTFIPRDVETRRRPLDILGLVLISPGLLLLLHSATVLSAGGESRQVGFMEFAGAVVLLAVFILHSVRRNTSPLLDLKLFKGRTFSAAALIQFMATASNLGGQFLLPLFYLTLRGRSPADAGLLLMPAGLGMFCAMWLVGPLNDRFGPRWVVLCGALLVIAGTLPFAFASLAPSQPVLVAALFVRGAALGVITIPTVSIAYAGLTRSAIPTATTTLNLVQRLGGPIGTTALALFLQYRAGLSSLSGEDAASASLPTIAGTSSTLGAAFLGLAILAAIVAGMSLLLPSKPAIALSRAEPLPPGLVPPEEA